MLSEYCALLGPTGRETETAVALMRCEVMTLPLTNLFKHCDEATIELLRQFANERSSWRNEKMMIDTLLLLRCQI
jgi:hypothetical protein